jgi:hypothetical protein
MNHIDIITSVKEQLAEHPKRRGTRYPESLQKEVGFVAMKLREQGCSYSDINKELGMTGEYAILEEELPHMFLLVPKEKVCVPM